MMLSNTHLAMILDTLARRLYEQADPYDDVVADVAEALDALFWLLTANDGVAEEAMPN